MAKSPYPINPELTGIAIAYRNEAYIADIIAPRRTVGKELFEWDEWTMSERFTIPDTTVGRLSKPNQVTFSAVRKTDSTADYALDTPVAQKDLDNADPGQNILGYATEGVAELIALDREKRVADIVFNSNTYLASQRETLSGASQWSDPTSRPIQKILSVLDNCIVRPNTMVIGQPAWTQLRQNPEIVEAVLGTAAQRGVVTTEQLANVLELNQVVVGRSWQNAAREGQPENYVRLWGKHCALITWNPLAQLTATAAQQTFMLTAQFGNRTAGSITDPDLGMDGGVRVRVGEKVKELVVSAMGGYYLQNCVA